MTRYPVERYNENRTAEIIGDLFGWLAIAGFVVIAGWAMIQGRRGKR